MSITLYGQPDCPPCKSVERKLNRENVTYDYVDVADNPQAARKLANRGMTTTPVIETPTEMYSALNTKKLNATIEQSRSAEVSQPGVQAHSGMDISR